MTVEVSLSFKDAETVARLVNATTSTFNYQAEIDGLPNPEDPIQFTRRMWAERMQAMIVKFERTQARTAFDATVVIDTPEIIA